MITKTHNLFIIGESQLTTKYLNNYLKETFDKSLNISIFNSKKSALEKIDSNIDIVILDNSLTGLDENDVLKDIKKISPNTAVILLSSNEEIKLAIEAFRNGATDYVLKGSNTKKRIIDDIYHILYYPIRVLTKEFGISTYMAIFFVNFITIGVLVLIGFVFINY